MEFDSVFAPICVWTMFSPGHHFYRAPARGVGLTSMNFQEPQKKHNGVKHIFVFNFGPTNTEIRFTLLNILEVRGGCWYN